MFLGGVIVFSVGVLGTWHTSVMMDAAEQANAPFSTAPRPSFVARVVPGPRADPARYLDAVNNGAGNATSLGSAAMLVQKPAMDRWEAVLGFGLALLATSFTRPGANTGGNGDGDEAPSSSAADLGGC